MPSRLYRQYIVSNIEHPLGIQWLTTLPSFYISFVVLPIKTYGSAQVFAQSRRTESILIIANAESILVLIGELIDGLCRDGYIGIAKLTSRLNSHLKPLARPGKRGGDLEA